MTSGPHSAPRHMRGEGAELLIGRRFGVNPGNRNYDHRRAKTGPGTCESQLPPPESAGLFGATPPDPGANFIPKKKRGPGFSISTQADALAGAVLAAA